MNEPSLKRQTIGALLWNLLDRAGQQVLLFITGVWVANLLAVEDYALVGMLAIFSAVANILLDSGFSAALIQKKEAGEAEFCSVFWFNLGCSLALYALLVGGSPLIARFFGQPRLVPLSAVVFLTLPINALSLVQSTILTKRVQFAQLTRANLLSTTIAALAALLMALSGWGVWTLALQPVLQAAARSVLLWSTSRWRPRSTFSMAHIRPLFRFASRLMAAGLLNTCFLNAYSLVIGKLFPARQLGLYTQANKLTEMGVTLLYSSIQGATFPIFSSIQEEKERLVRAYRKTVRLTSFLTFPAMLGLMVCAEPAVRLLLKEEWWPCVPFVQWLCAGGCFTILTAVNNNFLKVSGRTDRILHLEYWKIALTLAVVAATLSRSVLCMVGGLALTRLLVYLVNTLYTARCTGYGAWMQLRDVAPYLLLALASAGAVWPLRYCIEADLLLLAAQAAGGAAIYLGCCRAAGSKILQETMQLLQRNSR